MHRRLGGPLPHQLANAPQVHLQVLHPNFNNLIMRSDYLSGISNRFQSLSQSWRQVTYVLLTRSPLSIRRCFVRLACIRHAASVHPEPGSNSPFDLCSKRSLTFSFLICFFKEVSLLLNWRFLVQFSKIEFLRHTLVECHKIILFFLPSCNPFFHFFWYFFCLFLM